MEATAALSLTDQPLDEVGALITTLMEVPADAPTACAGWTAHELTAHLAAGAAEEAELIEAHLAGGGPRETRGMAEREAPFRALPDDQLRDRLIDEGLRLTELLVTLAACGEGESVSFTGRATRAEDFAMHSRSECALHRWDLVGSDAVSLELLAQPSLTAHAIRILMEMPALPEAFSGRAVPAAEGRSHQIVLRSLPADDVVVSFDEGGGSLRLGNPDEEPPTLALHPADRLLLLWGRRPAGIDPARLEDDAGLRLLTRR